MNQLKVIGPRQRHGASGLPAANRLAAGVGQRPQARRRELKSVS
jgi:hypothetical protein